MGLTMTLFFFGVVCIYIRHFKATYKYIDLVNLKLPNVYELKRQETLQATYITADNEDQGLRRQHIQSGFIHVLRNDMLKTDNVSVT